MFFSRAPAGGQSLPIPSIEHRRSAPAKLVLRVRAGAFRPRPSAHPWCAPWLVLFFVRVTSIEHRRSAPRPFGERSGRHLPSGSRFFWSHHLNRTSPKRSRALSGAFWPSPTLVFLVAFPDRGLEGGHVAQRSVRLNGTARGVWAFPWRSPESQTRAHKSGTLR